jgi:hypothetical protein
MKFCITLSIAAALLAGSASADDTELAGMKSKVPEGWKEEPPANQFRLTQYKTPKAEGDKEEAEVVVFYFKAGSGSVDDNVKRQLAKFKAPQGKTEVESKKDKIKVGKIEATFLDVKGTFLSKKGGPFDPNAKVTEKPEWRELYVIFTTTDGEYYVWLLGPAKTVEKQEKAFKDWLTNFK